MSVENYYYATLDGTGRFPVHKRDGYFRFEKKWNYDDMIRKTLENDKRKHQEYLIGTGYSINGFMELSDNEEIIVNVYDFYSHLCESFNNIHE